MNNIKRALGVVWMLLGPAAIIFMIWQANDKIGIAQQQVTMALTETAKSAASSNATNTILQWFIIILVFLPIASGLVIFGRYALAGEYDKLPESSNEL